MDLDTSLLDSSPPDGTELRQANAMPMRNINSASDLTPPTKRYTGRMARAFERLHTEMVTMIQKTGCPKTVARSAQETENGQAGHLTEQIYILDTRSVENYHGGGEFVGEEQATQRTRRWLTDSHSPVR